MDKAKADRAVVSLAIQELGKEAILGIFGPEEYDQMIGKMFAVMDLAAHLRISNIKISVSLEELISARKEYLKEIVDDE